MRVASYAVCTFMFGVSLFVSRSSPPSSGAPRAPETTMPVSAASRAAAPAGEPRLCVAEPVFGCGEVRCTRDADCPSTCGGCIAWSGTCALFRPQ